MFATALIVFREVLEAALVVGIVMAATRGLRGRNIWVGIGVGVGVAAAALVALFAEALAEAAAGMGQELFNATVLFVAVAMLGWHNVWMSRAGRAMGQEIAAIGRSVRAAERSMSALAVVVGVAVLREGSEVVLFLYGIAASEGANAGAMFAGGMLGLTLGVAAGAAIYFGLVRFAGRYLFAITGGLILFLAAGMAAQGAKFLTQAGYLPPLGHGLWDSSSWIADQGPLGTLLHALVGYTARPDGIQLLFYLVTLFMIGGLMYIYRKPSVRTSALAVSALAAAAGAFAAYPHPARAADLTVFSPIVEKGEFALEYKGNVAHDNNSNKDGAQVHIFEIEYAPTDYWRTAVEGELKKDAEGNLKYEATEWENVFQFFPQGEQWLDLGLRVSYEIANDTGDADAIEVAPLVEKSVGPVTITLNPIFEKEVGNNSNKSTEFKYAARAMWRLMPQLQPAVEAFGDIGEIGKTDPSSDQRHQVGPVLLGKFGLGGATALRYEVGYLAGLTSGGSPDGVFKWLVELEHHF